MHQARFDQSQDRGTNITIHEQLTEPGDNMVKLLVSRQGRTMVKMKNFGLRKMRGWISMW